MPWPAARFPPKPMGHPGIQYCTALWACAVGPPRQRAAKAIAKAILPAKADIRVPIECPAILRCRHQEHQRAESFTKRWHHRKVSGRTDLAERELGTLDGFDSRSRRFLQQLACRQGLVQQIVRARALEAGQIADRKRLAGCA